MTKIRVNVFDLIPVNRLLRFAKLGIYHTSVVIGDRSEYYHGYKFAGQTGIDSPEVVDKLPSSMSGDFYATYEIGESKYSYEECLQIVQEFKESDRYLSEYYNFLFHNCNQFTYELCQALVGEQSMKSYPMWVFRSEKLFRFAYRISVSAIFSAFHKPCPGFGPEPPSSRVMIKSSDSPMQPHVSDETQDAMDVETADHL